MRFPTGFTICLLALAFAGPATAAQAERPLVGAVPDWVMPAQADSATPAAASAPVQVLMSDQQMRITTEHVEGYSATRVKILSPQGLAALGTLSFAWNPDSDVLTVHRLSVTRDGTSEDLLGNGEAFTILRREDQLEQAILTGMLTAVLQPPGLRVGDVIDMSYTLRRRDPVVHENPDGAYLWSNTMVPNARFRALWPDTLPLRWRGSAHMPAATHEQRDGWHELSYHMQDLGPLLQPTSAPARYSALRMVELSTYPDWQALSRRFGPLYVEASQLAADSPLKAEVARIRREHATPEARAAAALRYVQDEIRYVLLAMNTGGLMPAKADETLQRRFGDCKAKSALLLALLRELGIEGEVVAVSTAFGDGLDTRLPGIGLFDHVLVRARIGGKTYWLDGTRQGDRVLARIRPPAFFWALPLTARGSDLVQIPREPLAEPESQITVEIDASGGVQVPAPLKTELRLTGDAAYGLKLAMDAEPEASRSEGMRAYWRGALRGAELEDLASAFDEQLGVLTWTATGTIEMEWDPEYNTYEPHNMGLGYRADFSRPRGTDATAPYAVAFPSWSRHVEKIRLPQQRAPFTVTGSDIERTVAGGEFRRTARVTGNLFTAESSYRSIATEFPASERTEAERVLLEMSRNNLYLKKPERYLPTEAELAVEAKQEFDSADNYYSLGMDMLERDMYDDAIKAFDEALTLDPGNISARIGRAQAHHERGDADGAISELNTALASHPDNERLLGILAASYARRGDHDKAVEIFDRLLARKSDEPAMLQRARSLRKLMRHDEAMRDVEAIIAARPDATDPAQLEARMIKAMILMDTDRDEDLSALARSMGMGDALWTQVRWLSGMVEAAGERALALKYVDRMLARQPSAGGHITRAGLVQDKAAAMSSIRTALRERGALEVDAIQLLVNRKWYREAVDTLNALEANRSVSFRAIGLRGIAHWHLGEKGAARADFTEARSIAPPDPGMLTLCNDKVYADVALDEALKDCEGALAEEPGCLACRITSGVVLLKLNRPKDAEAAFDQALGVKPDDPASLYGRGIAKVRSGDEEGGRRDTSAAEASSPLARFQFEQVGLRP